jgi:hypothetical protein
MKKIFFLIFRSYFLKFFFKFNYTLRKTVNEEKILLYLKNFKIYQTNHQLIRLGESGDGGYLVPDDLDGITACFTGGVGPMIKFEHDLANRGVKCFMADYSVDSLPPPLHPNFLFIKKFLGTQTDNIYINCNQWLSENMKNIRVTNLGQIKEADINFGDLTLFVGPQATGKSILLQLIKEMTSECI